MGQGISLKSERNNPWFKPWFNILLHTQSIFIRSMFRVLGMYNFGLHDKVGNKESSSTIFLGQFGESPDVTQSNGIANRCQNVGDFWVPGLLGLLAFFGGLDKAGCSAYTRQLEFEKIFLLSTMYIHIQSERLSIGNMTVLSFFSSIPKVFIVNLVSCQKRSSRFSS